MGERPKLRQLPDDPPLEEMSPLKTAFAIAALLVSMILPAAAAAETVVPPGNSAATQYTEAFPTAGGNAVSNNGINGGSGGSSPSKVLGHGNAKKLESQGKTGREVAKLAAETAPSRGAAAPAASQGTGGTGGHSQAPGANGGGGAGGGSGGAPAHKTASPGAAELPSQHLVDSAKAGDGSSGLGQVVGQATGSSDGQLGLLLPLILLGTVIWAATYAWRRRRRPAH